LIRSIRLGEPFEVGDGLSRKLVAAVMAFLMGAENSSELRRFYSELFDYLQVSRLNNSSSEDVETGRQAGRRLMQYLSELWALRSASPKRDLMTELTRLDEPDPQLMLAMCAHMLVAGIETTVGGIMNALYALFTHRDQLQLLRSDLSRVASAFDEGLRWMSPLQLKGKAAVQPSSFGDCDVEAGDRLVLLIGSAHRDPARYDAPDEYMIERPNTHHLAFGAGVHYCLGAPLARLEGITMIRRLLETFPTLDVDPSRPPPRVGGLPIYASPRELWLVAS
jgi:cytochrome P450